MNGLNSFLCRLPLSAAAALSITLLPAAVGAQTTAAADPTAASSYTDLGYGQYPRVTNAEQQLLGKTYEKDPLNTRVARLETKQFGKTSPNDDLADRLDRLDAVLPHKAPVFDENSDTASNTPSNTLVGTPGIAVPSTAVAGSGSSQPGAPQYSASDYGSYPRVTELEQQLLGSSYVKDPLPVRVARLETKEFGKTTPNDDLCDRIDRLDKVANPNKKSKVADNTDAATQEGGSGGGRAGGGGKGAGFGKTLLGMLGGAMGGGMFGNGIGNGLTMNQMMPGLQDSMRKDAAEEREQKQQAAAGGKPVAGASSPFAPGAVPIVGAENKIAIIEKFVLGKEHAELPLAERVEHVEKKLVPYEHHQAGQDLNIRVDHLWSILAAANRPSTKSVAASQGPTQ